MEKTTLYTTMLRKIALIIKDVMMGERTEGFFAVQEIRRVPELQSIPIFVLSAIYSKEEGFSIAPQHGWLAHDAFFSKPVDLSRLLQKIQEYIRTEDPGDGNPGNGEQAS